jgi:hypothetical protein
MWQGPVGFEQVNLFIWLFDWRLYGIADSS